MGVTMAKILSAGVIPARRTAAGWRILVLRAFRNWDFPKGVVGAGEDAKAAAVRETAEETAISNLDFAFGDGYRETMPYAGGKVARYYLAVTEQEGITLPVSAELGRAEHDEWRWVDFTDAASLLPPRLQPILEWARATLTRDE
jgi:8-oxo-dGTP pyrophosphatase MutT (NUDIX family)